MASGPANAAARATVRPHSRLSRRLSDPQLSAVRHGVTGLGQAETRGTQRPGPRGIMML
jgi:hypothetical protein